MKKYIFALLVLLTLGNATFAASSWSVIIKNTTGQNNQPKIAYMCNVYDIDQYGALTNSPYLPCVYKQITVQAGTQAPTVSFPITPTNSCPSGKLPSPERMIVDCSDIATGTCPRVLVEGKKGMPLISGKTVSLACGQTKVKKTR